MNFSYRLIFKSDNILRSPIVRDTNQPIEFLRNHIMDGYELVEIYGYGMYAPAALYFKVPDGNRDVSWVSAIPIKS